MKRTEGEISVREGYEHPGLVDEQGFEIFENTNMAINVNVPDDRHWGSYPNGHREVEDEEATANAEHIRDTWNASKDMTTKRAVAYLRHGAEMVELIYSVIARGHFDKICKCSLCALERMARELLTKLAAIFWESLAFGHLNY